MTARSILAGARSVAVPVGFWVAAAGVVVATSVLSGRSAYDANGSSYGDQGLYKSIAQHGYDLFRCGGEWCGNAAWFPAYPWVVRFVALTGMSVNAAGLVVSWLFALGTLVLLWLTFLRRRLDFVGVIVLAYAAFAPGQAWDYAVFPLSMLSFFTIGYLWLLARERWLHAGLVGAVLVLIYPVAGAAPVAAALWILVAFRNVSWRERARRIALCAGPALGAVAALFFYFHEALGHWNALFLVGAKYHNNLQQPLAPVFHAVSELASGPSGLHFAISLQTLLVTSAVACVLVFTALRYRQLERWELLVLLWVAVTWLIPSATARLTVSRVEATLLPIALLVGRLPRPLAVAFVAAAVLLSVPIDLLFIRHTLG